MVYFISYNSVTIEFVTPELAEVYKNANNLDVEVQFRQPDLIPEAIPAITARQLRLQLVKNGKTLNDIDIAIAQLPNPDKLIAEIEWQYASEFEREHPLVFVVAALLGFTEAELNQLWKDAAKL